jgi:hypothetical protein
MSKILSMHQQWREAGRDDRYVEGEQPTLKGHQGPHMAVRERRRRPHVVVREKHRRPHVAVRERRRRPHVAVRESVKQNWDDLQTQKAVATQWGWAT